MEESTFLALSTEEQDIISDGYDIETDISIDYDERLERQIRASLLPSYQIAPQYLTPVKTQFSSNCWVYAAICSLETHLLMNGKVPSNTDDYADYSEAHFTYDIFDMDVSGSKKNSRGKIPKPPSGAKTKCSYGGNKLLAAAYFARGNSTVAEITDPCPPRVTTTSITARSSEVGIKKEKKFYVSSYEFLNNPQGKPPCANFIDNVKERIERYSSVSVSLLWNTTEFMNTVTASGKETRSYYSPEKSLIIAKKIKYGHHAVSIIGWDDNYSKTNFKAALGTYSPNSDGAFLCRNSHGTSNSWDGTFWLSYEDANMKNCACIREVIDDVWELPNKVYSRATFGMQDGVISGVSTTQPLEFSVKYTTETDNESLIYIGLFNLVPCVANVKLVIGTNVKQILSGIDLYYAGYRAVPLPTPEIIAAAGTDFTIECTYTPYTYGNVYAPYEKHIHITSTYDPFANILLQPGTCFVNGNDISTFSSDFGNIALYALMRDTGTSGTEIKQAIDSATLPSPTGSRIDNLPLTSHNQKLEWRLEPVEGAQYMPGSPFVVTTTKQYKVGASVGIINTSTTDDVTGYITCVAGDTSGFAMKKAFKFNLPKYQAGTYTFTVGDVTDANAVDINGTFPINGATVEIEANNADKKIVTVDNNGNWNVTGFRLYKDAWDDAYANTTINVTIYDDGKANVLQSGIFSKTLEKPFTFDPTAAIAIAVVTVLTASGIIFTIGWLIKKYCAQGTLATCCCGGATLTAPHGGHPYLRVQDANLTNNGLFDEVQSLENVNKIKTDFVASGNNATDFGGLAKIISKGGYVRNCSISGKCDAQNTNFGGLFLTGEDVEVSDCSVNLNVTDAASYGAVAYSLTGNSKVSNITVNGTAAADSAAGIAINFNGTAENININLDVTAKQNAAGVACNSNANISKANIDGNYTASNGNSSGMVINYSGGTISDSRISAGMSGSTGAAGVVLNQTSNAVIKNCYVAGSITSASGKAIGIAEGISGNPSAVSKCLCVCSKISGTSSMRISSYPSESCIAYDRIFSDNTLVSSGETVKTAAELLSASVYSTLGWNLTDIWAFDSKKLYAYLKNVVTLYDYPFPNVYPTKDDKYVFSVGNPIAFYGANNKNTAKLKWAISSTMNMKSNGEADYLLKSDEFYLQLMLSGTAPSVYDFTITAVIDSHDYSLAFPISIV